MHADAHQPSKLECPRCGYDIAATLANASQRGQTVVTCSECGLESDALAVERGADCPPWLVESRIDRHRTPSRFIRTLFRSLWPRGFWRALRMEAPISRRGLVSYVVGIAVALHLAAVAAVAPVVYADQKAVMRSGGSMLADLAVAAVLPLCPATGHDLLRAAAQGSPNRSVDLGTLARFAFGAFKSTAMREPFLFSHVPQRAGADGAYATSPPPEPTNATAAFLVPNHRLLEVQRGVGIALTIASVPLVATLLLALLPASLRRAKVRRAHLVRAAIYSLGAMPMGLALLATWLSIVILAESFANLSPRMASSLAKPVFVAIPVAALLFSILSLHAVSRHYLRLPHAWLIAGLLNFATILAFLLVAVELA